MTPAELAAIRERHAATAAERAMGECARCDLPIDEDSVRCEETEGWSACVLPIDDEAHGDRADLLREVERLTAERDAAQAACEDVIREREVARQERDAARLSGDGEHARADRLWVAGNAAREEVERLRTELAEVRRHDIRETVAQIHAAREERDE